MKSWIFLIFTLVSLSEACGNQSGGALCQNGLCCSQFGFCGSTDDYCGNGCQSQCTASLISQSLFDEILKHRNDASCPGKGFYTYDAFIAATSFFDSFGTTGDNDTRKREIAAFLAQTSHVTSGGGLISPDGPYAWGYCYVEQENNSDNRCEPSTQWPCAPGEKYYGRGPIQISYNYNYGPAGKAIGFDLLKNPELVATDPIVSFKTALWYWMTPQSLDPSCHNVITGGWEPTNADKAAGRVPGYGMITNIISRGVECSEGANDEANNIGFYTRYCDILGVSYGDNLSCSNQSLVPRGKELPPINGAMVFLGSHHASGGSSTRVVQGQLTSFTVSIFAATWWMWQLL